MAQQPRSGAAAGAAAGGPLVLPAADSVLDLVSDLHAFELQLAMLRRRARQLAADRALIQQQLTKQRPQPSLAAAVAAGEQLGGPSGAKCSAWVCLQQQQQPTALKQSQQQLPAVVNTSSSRALKRTAAGSAAAALDREVKRQQQQQGAGGVVGAGEAAAASAAGQAAAGSPAAHTKSAATATAAAGTRRDTPAKRPLHPAHNTAATAVAATTQPAAAAAAAAPAAKKTRVAGKGPLPAVHSSPAPQPAAPAAAEEKLVPKQPWHPPKQLHASQQINGAAHAAGAAAAGGVTPAAATEQQAALIAASKHQQQLQVPAATDTAAGREQQQPQAAPSSSRQLQSAGNQQAPEQSHVQTKGQQQHKQVQQQPLQQPAQPQQPAQAWQEQQRPPAEQAPQKQQQPGQNQQPKAVQQRPQRQQQQAQQAAPNAANKQQLQQGAISSTSPQDGVCRQQQQQQQPGQARLQQQQQQQQSRKLPHAPLSAPARRNADAALKAAATNLQADVRTLAAARAAAGRPLPLVPPLGQPGAQPVLLQVADGATVRALVQLLCPSLDALLALTRETAGHLAEVPYGPVEPGQPHWQSELMQPQADPSASQLLSPSGTKVAMQRVTLPSLKAACTRALAAAVKPRSRGVRTFFWAVQQQLKAELQHGATAQQDSQEQAAEVLRSCVLSCAHVARCLVTMHNILVTVSQQQQQQRQRQQAAAAAAGDGGARAVPAGAAAKRGDHALQPEPPQQPQEGGLLPLAPQSAAAQDAAAQAIAAAAAALGHQKVIELLLARRAAGQQLDTRVRASGQGVVVVIVPAAEARPLVRMLCPGLDALLALSPATAPPLHNLPFRPVDETDGIRWECRLNQPVPGLQLQSVAGIKYALGAIPYESFKADVLRVLNSTAAAADAPPAAAAAAAGGQAGNNAGLRGFFWVVQALLCTQVENGVTARQGSKAQASGVLNQYVHGVAGVANLLVSLYNLLLAAPGGAGDAGHGVAPAPAGAAVAAQPAQQQQG